MLFGDEQGCIIQGDDENINSYTQAKDDKSIKFGEDDKVEMVESTQAAEATVLSPRQDIMSHAAESNDHTQWLIPSENKLQVNMRILLMQPSGITIHHTGQDDTADDTNARMALASDATEDANPAAADSHEISSELSPTGDAAADEAAGPEPKRKSRRVL